MNSKGTANKVILLANVGQEPEVKHTSGGAAVTTLSVATNEVWKDNDGNKQERTEWHRVILWRKLAEIAGEYIKKGSKVYIEGRLQTRSWEDKDGVKKYTTEIIADTMIMVSTKTDGQGITESPAQEQVPEADEKNQQEAKQEADLPK